MKTKAIVFDLDGTLLNTLTDLTVSVNYMLDKFAFPLKSESEIRSYLGNGIRVLVAKSLPETEKSRLDECLAVFKSHYDVHKDDNTAPYDGIVEMLKDVRAAGLKSAIVSNKYDAAVRQLKEETFSGLIDFAVGERTDLNPKPAPDGVLLALKTLGVSREESVYVGDSEVDLLTAKNSGLNCIAVTWGFRDKQDLINGGAKFIADTPSEILALLKSEKIFQ